MCTVNEGFTDQLQFFYQGFQQLHDLMIFSLENIPHKNIVPGKTYQLINFRWIVISLLMLCNDEIIIFLCLINEYINNIKIIIMWTVNLKYDK